MPEPTPSDEWHSLRSREGLADAIRRPVAPSTAASSPTAESSPTGADDDAAMPAPDDAVAKTGTTTVALAAADAVVLAADRRASIAGGRIVANKSTRKIAQVHPTAAMVAAGAVGSIQAFARGLRAETSIHGTRRGEPPGVEALATLAGNLLRGGAYPGVGVTLGGVGADGPAIYDLDGGGGVLDADYVADGSGMQYVLGVLEREYEPGLSREEAVALAGRAVESAVERDTASGNGVTVAEVTAEGVDIREGATVAEIGEEVGSGEVAG